MYRPGVELATSRSQVPRPNRYTTEPIVKAICISNPHSKLCRKYGFASLSTRPNSVHSDFGALQIYLLTYFYAHVLYTADLIPEGEPSAALGHSETACVVVNCSVVDVSEHVISGDDVILGVVSFPPSRRAG